MDSPAIRPGIVEQYGAWMLVQKSRPRGKTFDPLINTKSVKVTTTVKQPYGDSDCTEKAMISRYDILTEFQVPDQIEIPESSAAREISGNDQIEIPESSVEPRINGVSADKRISEPWLS
jgi:hypothetical protein